MDRSILVLERISRVAIGLAFCVLIFAVTIQVLGRIIIGSPVWTEELTRYALLFLAAFGAGLSFRSGDLVNIDIICESLPGRWPLRARIFSAVATVLLCMALFIPAWKYTRIGALQTSPAMGIPMNFVHVSILILLVSLMLFAAVRVISIVTGQSEGRPNPMLGTGA